MFFVFLLYFSIFKFSPFIDKCISTIQYNIPCKYLSVHTLFERYRLHNLWDRIIAKGKRKKLILVKVKDKGSRSPSTAYICRLDTDSTVLGRRTPLWLVLFWPGLFNPCRASLEKNMARYRIYILWSSFNHCHSW